MHVCISVYQRAWIQGGVEGNCYIYIHRVNPLVGERDERRKTLRRHLGGGGDATHGVARTWMERGRTCKVTYAYKEKSISVGLCMYE